MFYQPKFRCFQCIQEDNLDKSFSCHGNYIQHGEPKIDILDKDMIIADKDYIFTFFGRSYDESLLISGNDFNILCLLARKGILQLEQAAIKADTSFQATDYSEIRKRICELCLASRVFITNSVNNYQEVKNHIAPCYKNVLRYIKRLQNLPGYVILNSAKQNENTNQDASYNYIHLALDIFWITLTSEHFIDDEPNSRIDIFEQNLNTLITDLIFVSAQKFERLNGCTNLIKESPFNCSCFKELWLLIQLYVEKLHSQHFCEDFWHYFNAAIKTKMNLQNCTNGKDAVLCLWILHHISCIHGYNSDGSFIGPQHHRVVSNYTLIEQCLRIVTNVNSSQIDEKLMSSCLYLLASFQMIWWKKDATFDILQQLWEYFYKRLNTSFSFSNEPEYIIGNSLKAYDYKSLTETILELDLKVPSVSVNSYDIFLCFLGKYLIMNPSHWLKLKGRIYSKLPPPKLAALTDIGLHNLNQLFFVLAYSVNFNELTDKLQFLLNQLPASRSENSTIIWSAHVSLLLMRANRKMAFNDVSGTEICTPILLGVHSASSDRSQSHLMRIYIDGLKKLIECDPDLQCQEYSLFGNWINRYLQWCSHSDACYLLDILKNLIENIRNLGGHPAWWTVIETNVVPSIIALSSVVDAPQQVSELAVSLITADENRFKNLLEHMTGENISISLALCFLTSLLEQNRCVLDKFSHPSLLIQAWVRIANLSTDKSDLAELTAAISHLPQWPTTMGNFQISSTEDPLYFVIRSAGCKMRNTRNMTDTIELKRWFETYFGKMDRWIAPVLSAAEKGENAQLVMRIYTSAALLFLHCAPALYAKNKNTCILYRLISSLLLPSSVLMNKKPPNVILAALKRTWHLFVRGIGRLDFKSDIYIERILKDMVIRYVPHMNDASSPIIRCLDKELEDDTTTFILDKIVNTFLIRKSRNSPENTLQALKLILEMCRIQNENETKVQILTKTALPLLFEQLIFTEDTAVKNIVVQILESLKSNQYFLQLREIFKNAILDVIDKHLPFYSTKVFNFIETIVNILCSEVAKVLPDLQEAVKDVERRRGVGFDNNLRKGLKRIQELISQHSK